MMTLRSARGTRGLFGLTLLWVLLWPKEAWVSGAMSASGLSRSYKISVSELSYPIGNSTQWTEAEQKADERLWQTRLADAMAVTDQWLALQIKDKRIAPAELTLDTALVGPLRPTQAGGPLLRPVLVDLPACQLTSSNLGVVVHIVLQTLPTPAERTALSSSLCALLKDPKPPQNRLQLAMISSVRAERDALQLALDENFSVPLSELPAVTKLRADFFQRATQVMLRSCHRFEAQHPGVTLRRVSGLGTNAVRFYMEAPFGGFDLLTEMFAAPGKNLPNGVALKDTLYEDWRAAGLPMQVELPALLKGAAH